MAQSPHSLRSATKITPRASRHARPTTSYEEPSSDIDEELYHAAMASDSGASVDAPRVSQGALLRGRPRPTAIITKRRQQQSPTSQLSNSLPRVHSRAKRRRTANTRTKIDKSKVRTMDRQQPSGLDIYSSGIVPPWGNLPYQILLQIFEYASYPLYEQFFQPTPSVHWLLQTSRLCRAFAEPALTVLYRSPPLIPMERAHKLRQLLLLDPTLLSFNYRAKVEKLQIEISQTAAYTLQGHGLLDLYGLIHNCPRLLSLELYHQKDMSPYKCLDHKIKWTYPDTLFEALSSNVDGFPTKLQSWRWSSRLAEKRWPVEKLREAHLLPSFNSLRKVTFTNYQVPRLRKNEPDPEHEKKIASCLIVLPDLQHLILESSTIVNAIFLPLLPKNLKHLEIINCWEIMADDVAAFLMSHGNQLETLTLNHNQSLSLSFLTVLGDACPRLRSLKMNLTYYNIHSSYHDSDPLYKELLSLDEIPNWPSSLETLELTQLRKWDLDTAKMFFQSLLRSAPTLPNLRRLSINAILNTSWRDRSTFRDTWVGAFERVFKRPLVAPNPNLRSQGAFNEWKRREMHAGQSSTDNYTSLQQVTDTSKDVSDFLLNTTGGDVSDSNKDLTNRKTRRSGRLISNGLHSRSRNSHVTNNTIHDRDANRRQNINRELVSLQQAAGIDGPHDVISRAESSAESTSDEEVSDSDDEPLVHRARGSGHRHKEFIQGMCDLVHVRIDNLRPAETQFREADFLDSEPDDDGDWDEDVDGNVDAAYAW